ncbi:MAG TPA: HypC/HybG/HupF family hydrogenase formation chaperone [Acidimicrobiales bacterium]|nr:HypC/HybG/HupF family hydrogenase formation chaperone [Acidimicrobiales bacterium]
MCQHRLQRVVEPPSGGSVRVEDLDGVLSDVSLLAFTDGEPAPGDWLLVHSGYALARVDQDEATATVEELAAAGRARRVARPGAEDEREVR